MRQSTMLQKFYHPGHMCLLAKKRKGVKTFLVLSQLQKTACTSAKDRKEKINELQAMIFDEESASDAQKFLAPPKRRILEKKKLMPTF